MIGAGGAAAVAKDAAFCIAFGIFGAIKLAESLKLAGVTLCAIGIAASHTLVIGQ